MSLMSVLGMSLSYTFAGFLCVFGFAIIYRTIQRRFKLPLPPGPPGLPIIGNALQMPIEHEWLTFTQWAKTYGKIMHMTVLGRSIVVLSSPDAIFELLDKRSSIYSDRAFVPMAGELVGLSKFISLEPYGNRHREGRKLLMNTVNQRKAPEELNHIRDAKVAGLLLRLSRSPAEFHAHLRWFVASVVFQVTYGHNVESSDDSMVKQAEQVMDDFAAAVKPGAFLVDSLPFLQYIPDWFPGAGFMAVANQMRQRLHNLRDEPYNIVKEQVKDGTALPCLVASLLESNSNPTPEEESLWKTTATALYAGGADTTVSALASFFLVMSLYPDVQKKAQAELDRVVPSGRLPNSSDRPQLPYVEALMKEIYRWNPVLPFAIPHKLTQDDIYDGYLIPAGTIVVGNTWAVFHDPMLYPDPFRVIPERHMNSTGQNPPDPRSFAFGYGRRVCPGQIFADETLFSVVTAVLTTFNITKAQDPSGLPIEPDTSYTGGTISHPPPFECHITPRSAESERFITSISSHLRS